MVTRCEVCGSEASKTFEVVADGKRHVFDTVECALGVLAPRCEHCRSHILGHGVESDGKMYCCAHCAHAGRSDDRIFIG